MVDQLVANEFSGRVRFLPDSIRRALVVGFDENNAPSGNVSVVTDDNKLLVQVLLLSVESVDVGNSCRRVRHRTPCFDSWIWELANEFMIPVVQ